VFQVVRLPARQSAVDKDAFYFTENKTKLSTEIE